jgi:cell division septation protein DedD
LRSTPSTAEPQAAPPPRAQPQRLASANIPRRQPPAAQVATGDGHRYAERRVWLQLASGSNVAAFKEEFDRIKNRGREVMKGIEGYVTNSGGRMRLLIGPFRNTDEAEIFARDLETLRIDSFAWVNPPGQTIRELRSE